MVKYSLRTVHSDGVVVPPISLAKSTGNANEYIVRRVLLGEKAQLAPGMSRWVKVKVEQSTESIVQRKWVFHLRGEYLSKSIM